MPTLYNINPDSAHQVIISMGPDLDAVNQRLNQVILGNYANPPEVTKNTLALVAGVEQPTPWNSIANSQIPETENIECIVVVNLIQRQISHQLRHIAHPKNYAFMPTTEIGQTISWDPKPISQLPSTEIAPVAGSQIELFLTDWGAESQSAWKHTLTSIISYLQRREMLERLNVIAQREDNWDELGSMKPNRISLDRAEVIMMKLLDSVISNGDKWVKPYICSDEDGYVTVEWTGGKRQLYLRIEEDEVEYITLERINTKRKMGGDTIRGDDCFEIWKWLIDEQQ